MLFRIFLDGVTHLPEQVVQELLRLVTDGGVDLDGEIVPRGAGVVVLAQEMPGTPPVEQGGFAGSAGDGECEAALAALSQKAPQLPGRRSIQLDGGVGDDSAIWW